MNRPLGIVGGMGSFAGERLLHHALTTAVSRGAIDDDDFPKVIYYNLPVSGLDISGVSDGKQIFNQLRVAISQLESIGCDRIIIACNSVHVLHSKLQGMVAGQIINIVESGCRRAAPLSPVGVVCSETSKRSMLFDSALRRFDAECIHTNEEEQFSINSIIGSVIVNRHGREQFDALRTVAYGLSSRGAHSLLIGCTELSLVRDPALDSMPTFDCGFVAVEEAIGNG